MEAGEHGTLCSSLLHPSDALASLHTQEKTPWGEAASFRPSARRDATQGVGAEGEGSVGYPGPLPMLGMHWVYLQEQEEGDANSEPCKTPPHPAKSASTLHEWPTFLCVSVSMRNMAMGARRMPKT